MVVNRQPESELESRVNKTTTNLNNQVNNLNAQLRKLQAQMTHPAALTSLSKKITSLTNSVNGIISTPALAKTYYSPSSVVKNAGGVVVGDETGVTAPFDGVTYLVHEVAAAPGFDVDFVFTDVVEFNTISLGFTYNGTLLHKIQIQMYDYTNSAWRIFTTFSDMADYPQWITMSLKPLPDFIDTVTIPGQAKLKFYHITSGNAAHTITFDYITLIRDSDA